MGSADERFSAIHAKVSKGVGSKEVLQLDLGVVLRGAYGVFFLIFILLTVLKLESVLHSSLLKYVFYELFLFLITFVVATSLLSVVGFCSQ